VRLLQQANAGVAVARNRGIAAAQGQWVCFLDADDWLHPTYLSTLIEAQQRFPQADVVAADFVRIPHAEGPWPAPWSVSAERTEVELIERLARRWMDGPTLSSSSVAVRRLRLNMAARMGVMACATSLGVSLATLVSTLLIRSPSSVRAWRLARLALRCLVFMA
jgi:glycosyltransferase involved in cell wall biosynthesis